MARFNGPQVDCAGKTAHLKWLAMAFNGFGKGFDEVCSTLVALGFLDRRPLPACPGEACWLNVNPSSVPVWCKRGLTIKSKCKTKRPSKI